MDDEDDDGKVPAYLKQFAGMNIKKGKDEEEDDLEDYGNKDGKDK
jgi:hypothetical protein